MSPLTEVRLMLGRELRRSVRSAKGIILGLLTILGALVASLVCVWLESRARSNADSSSAYTELKKQVFVGATGDDALASYLATIPISLFMFLELTVWLSPLLVALLGFDVISGDLQHRTIRLWAVRSRRGSYFAAKLLGLWILVGLLTLGLNLLAGTVALARGYVTPVELFSLGARFWFVTFVIAGAWSAIATLISSCFRTPVLALMTTFAAFCALWILGAGGFIARQKPGAEADLSAHFPWYRYLYPNAYDMVLLSPETTRVLMGLGILVMFMCIVIALGSWLMQRRDV